LDWSYHFVAVALVGAPAAAAAAAAAAVVVEGAAATAAEEDREVRASSPRVGSKLAASSLAPPFDTLLSTRALQLKRPFRF